MGTPKKFLVSFLVTSAVEGPSRRTFQGLFCRGISGYSELGCLDSNQEQLNQNQPCCQLHHTPSAPHPEAGIRADATREQAEKRVYPTAGVTMYETVQTPAPKQVISAMMPMPALVPRSDRTVTGLPAVRASLIAAASREEAGGVKP